MILSAYFASTYTFTLGENGCFLAYFHPPQNLKVASCKGYRVLVRSKKAKKNVVIANFSKIEARLKALYVR